MYFSPRLQQTPPMVFFSSECCGRYNWKVDRDASTMRPWNWETTSIPSEATAQMRAVTRRRLLISTSWIRVSLRMLVTRPLEKGCRSLVKSVLIFDRLIAIRVKEVPWLKKISSMVSCSCQVLFSKLRRTGKGGKNHKKRESFSLQLMKISILRLLLSAIRARFSLFWIPSPTQIAVFFSRSGPDDLKDRLEICLGCSSGTCRC